MAKKLLVSSRKVVQPAQSKQPPKPSSSEDPSSPTDESSTKSPEEEVVVEVSTITPRGKQLRLPKPSNDSSSSESYAAIDSEESEGDTEQRTSMDGTIDPIVSKDVVATMVNGTHARSRKRKRPDISNYVMSNYIQEQLLLIAVANTQVSWDPEKSTQFRKDLSKGKVARYLSPKTETKQFVSTLTTKLEQIADSEMPRKRSRSPSMEEESKKKKVDRKPRSSSTVSSVASQKDYKAISTETLRQQADDIMKQARSLKHLGDKMEKTAQKDKGLCYLKSSVKFCQYALLLDDLKQIYRARRDNSRAKQFSGTKGVFVSTLSLIEAAARNFTDKKYGELAAISYKFAAIVNMYVFRLQRNVLDAAFRELNEAHKAAKVLGMGKTSPNSSELLSPPAPSSSPPAASSAMVPNANSGAYDVFMKEMVHVFKSFELWNRYKRSDASVLPDITDFATVKIDVAIEAIQKVLDSYNA